MKENLITEEEETILNIFAKLMKETGDLNRNVLIMPSKDEECKLIIKKKDNKWISYVKERGVIDPVLEYDDLYDCCMDIFDNLEKSSADYCTDIFQVLVQDIRKNKVKSKTM